MSGRRKACKKEIIATHVPDNPPIELIEYYEVFKNYYPECEMSTKRWFVDHIKDDWVLFDCGANIGYFSILFARLAYRGYVYAFEPTSTYSMLLKNLKYHHIQNVMPLKMALGKQSGEKIDSLYRIWGDRPDKKKYVFTTIDDFVDANCLARIDCIKIDVDSFDFEVLQGAERTLLKYNPYVMVELNHALSKRGQSNMQALDWLLSLGYKEALVLDYDNFLTRLGTKGDSKEDVKKITLYFE